MVDEVTATPSQLETAQTKQRVSRERALLSSERSAATICPYSAETEYKPMTVTVWLGNKTPEGGMT
jgi:hypothetical protein